jgi:hypothetical protein
MAGERNSRIKGNLRGKTDARERILSNQSAGVRFFNFLLAIPSSGGWKKKYTSSFHLTFGAERIKFKRRYYRSFEMKGLRCRRERSPDSRFRRYH